MRRLSIIVSCLVVFAAARSTSSSSRSSSVVDQLSTLDPEDRDVFIKVHLAMGLNKRSDAIPYTHRDPVIELPSELNISDDKFAQIQSIEVPQEFSENLLDYTRNEFRLDYDDVHTLVLNSQVCFPGEKCTELGDIGGICCPF